MNHKKYKISGILILQPAILMIIFIFMFVLINNGIVSVIRQEYIAAAETAALAGAGKLNEEKENPNANDDAVSEALLFATMYNGMEGPIQSGQVSVTLGKWTNCIFTPDNDSPNAVRVDIATPVDEDGDPSGLTALFGRIFLPFFQRIESSITAVGAFYEKAVVLVEYEGFDCVN